MNTDSYVYKEKLYGDWLVVEDLSEADYSYADDLDLYEVRSAGSRVARLDEWRDVVELLSEEKEKKLEDVF